MFYVLLSFGAHVEDVLSSVLLMFFCYLPANCACKSPGCAFECEAFNVAGCASVLVCFFFFLLTVLVFSALYAYVFLSALMREPCYAPPACACALL